MRRVWVAIGAVVVLMSPIVLADQFDPSSFSSQMGPEALHSILKLATVAQEKFQHIYAEFTVTCSYANGPAALPAHLIAVSRALERRELIAGSIHWANDRGSRTAMLSVQFDLDHHDKEGVLVTRLLVDNGRRQVELYSDSYQALITPSRPLASELLPSQWFFPGTTMTFAELESSGAAIDAKTDNQGHVMVCFRLQSSDNLTTAILDKNANYALIHWSCEGCRIATDVAYSTNANGDRVPCHAEQTIYSAEHTPLLVWTIETEQFEIGTPNPALFDQNLSPGTVVGDYFDESSGGFRDKPFFERINKYGVAVRTDPIGLNTKPSQSLTGTALGSVGALLLVAFVYRFLGAKKPRPSFG